MDRVKRKPQFQIRKVPLKRFIPQKTPQLYALDVHSICLPSKNRKLINWASVNCDSLQTNLQQQFNDQIIYSQAYQQLYSAYAIMREDREKERKQLMNQISKAELAQKKQKEEIARLNGIKDGLYRQIDGLRDQLTEVRQKNYNLRWEVNHQRGPHYANLNGYSLLPNNEIMTYEQMLQMEEQMGYVNRGLSAQQVDQLPKIPYSQTSSTVQLCCICYEEIKQGQEMTVLNCKHIHHCECIKDWLVKQKVCPICKQQVIPNQQT